MPYPTAAPSACDVLVIGAGPAGAMAAHAAARAGASVLLVDKAKFPREKVCGGCLSRSAVDLLTQAGLSHVLRQCGALPLNAAHVFAAHRSAVLPWDGVAVSRAALDETLVRSTGVTFIDGVAARLHMLHDKGRDVMLGDHSVVQARIVIAAHGLAGRLLHDTPHLDVAEDAGGRIGLSATLPALHLEPGMVRMHIAAAGYAGLVRLETGPAHLAAAIDPLCVRRSGGPVEAVGQIFDEAGVERPRGLRDAAFTGTPRLTRQRDCAAPRLLIVGDAAGYIEPFTGEGIAWALAAGEAAGALAAEFARQNTWQEAMADCWRQRRAQLLHARQRRCRWITRAVRRPTLVAAGLWVLRAWPEAASPWLNRLHRPFPVA